MLFRDLGHHLSPERLLLFQLEESTISPSCSSLVEHMLYTSVVYYLLHCHGVEPNTGVLTLASSGSICVMEYI